MTFLIVGAGLAVLITALELHCCGISNFMVTDKGRGVGAIFSDEVKKGSDTPALLVAFCDAHLIVFVQVSFSTIRTMID